ncbi:MAG: MarR family winged helix-turn-helix transcriptional regulator [Acidobacteriia bacterium]|nr:MarR family winged helix-turn-helix transcriptional regulator [Terriglobia bacterium]
MASSGEHINAISEVCDCLRAGSLEERSGEEREQLGNLLKAAQLQLLHIFTEPFTDRVETFLSCVRRAGSVVAATAGPVHTNPAYFLGQLDAMAELADLTRQQKIPPTAAKVLINHSDAPRIAAIVFEHGSIGLTRLAEKLGKHSQNLHSILRDMQAAQLLRRDELGRNVLFSPTPLTRAAIQWSAEESRAQEKAA